MSNEKFDKFREEFIKTETERITLQLRGIITEYIVSPSVTEIAFHINRKEIVKTALNRVVEEFNKE